MSKNNLIQIGGELVNTVGDGIIADAAAVKDYTEGKTQSIINAEIRAVIPSTASAQNQLADKNYVDTHSSDIDVDSELSTTSENPLQNKVVTTALARKQNSLENYTESDSSVNISRFDTETYQPIAQMYLNDGAVAGIEVNLNDVSSNIECTSTGIELSYEFNNDESIVTLNGAGFQFNGNQVVTAESISGKADKSEMSVIAGTGANADKTTIILKSGTSATVLTRHQDISGKQDTISDVTVAVDANTGTPAGTASFNDNTLAFSFQNLKGETGVQGPQGIQGVQGERGPKGDTGVTGDASSLAVIHGVDTTTSYATTDVAGADAVQDILKMLGTVYYVATT